MKKSLAHLPKHKRDELKLVTDIILDECPTVLMIVLFGSYARGDWVEDTYVENHITYEYASDFDILVIVRSIKWSSGFMMRFSWSSQTTAPRHTTWRNSVTWSPATIRLS
jgi:predicted nucleotidyltransferase